MKRIYAEVRCDYYCAEHNYWTVDAWMSADENDEYGKVVAVINGTTGDVWYCDPDARIDIAVAELIKAKVKEIRNPLGSRARRLVTVHFLKKHGFTRPDLFQPSSGFSYRLKRRDNRFDTKITVRFSESGKPISLTVERIDVETVKVKRSSIEYNEGITLKDFVGLCAEFDIDLLRD